MTTQLPEMPLSVGLAPAAPHPSQDGVRSEPGGRNEPGVRTYRGRRLEDLIPQIRAELGPHAVILREREGVIGGVGGFFARRCVEVDARAGGAGIDVYDDEDHEDASSDGGLPAAFADRLQDEITTAEAFDDLAGELIGAPLKSENSPAAPPELAEPLAPPPEIEVPGAVIAEEPLATQVDAEDGPVATEDAPVAAVVEHFDRDSDSIEIVPKRRGRAARGRTGMPTPRELDRDAATLVDRALHARGVTEAWSAELIVHAGAHGVPLHPAGDLSGAVRGAIARSLPLAAPLPAAGAVVAFVGAGGSGKTSCTAALAAAYARASTLPVTVIALGSRDRGRELSDLLKGHDARVAVHPTAQGAARTVAQGGLIVIDTPAPTPGHEGSTRALAADLAALAVDAALVALPATLGSQSARRLLESLRPIGPTGIAVTHVDETDQVGVAVELSVTTGLPIVYVHEGADPTRSLSAPDPIALAARIL